MPVSTPRYCGLVSHDLRNDCKRPCRLSPALERCRSRSRRSVAARGSEFVGTRSDVGPVPAGMREWAPDPQQFASYRSTSAKAPLAPILTSQFYTRLARLCETQGLATPRFTRRLCGSGNANGQLFQSLQHSERLLRLAESEFRTRPRGRGEILGVAAGKFQEQARRADRVAQHLRKPVRGARLRRMPALPAAAVGSRPAPTAKEHDCERALAEDLGFDATAESSTDDEACVAAEVRAKAPAVANEDHDQQYAGTEQEPGPQLRCVTRVPLMRDRVAALTEDAEAVVGWCSDGDIVQVVQDEFAATAASELDLSLDVAALVKFGDLRGWVALTSKEGDPQLMTIDRTSPGIQPTDGQSLDAPRARGSAHAAAHCSGVDGVAAADPQPQPEHEPETEPEPEPKVEPRPPESLADRCPWANHRELPSMSRHGADGGVYTIHGWLPTPPPSPSHKPHTRVALGSPNQVTRQINAQERLARARQFWVLIDNRGHSYGSLGSHQAPCIHPQA